MSKEFEDLTLITGAARSGTSMVAGIINLCGAWGGNLSGPNKNNEKGMFENRTIVDQITKPYLTSIRCDPMGQKPLPKIEFIHKEAQKEDLVNSVRNRFHKIFQSQGYKEGPLFYKGAKICTLWPIWAKAFPQAKWVIVRRQPLDIAGSCIHTNFMRAYADRKGWLGWVLEHEQRFEEMIEGGLHVQQVWPQQFIDGDFLEIKSVISNLGLSWNQEKVLDFVEPRLWNKKKG